MPRSESKFGRGVGASVYLLAFVLGLGSGFAPGAALLAQADEGRLEYRIKGKAAGFEDFTVAIVGTDLVWRSNSQLDVGTSRIKMQMKAAYTHEGGVPTCLRELESTIDVGVAEIGEIKIWGSFVGPGSQIVVEHPVSKFAAPILDRTSKPHRAFTDLVALEMNGGIALHGALTRIAAAAAKSGDARELSRTLLIPTADKSNLDSVTSTLLFRASTEGSSGSGALRVVLETQGVRMESRASADGRRLEKVSIPAQEFEAVRIGDRAITLTAADAPTTKPEETKSEAENRPHEEPFAVAVTGGELKGTLRRPHGSALANAMGMPAVLYLSIAGAQDRNENALALAELSLPAVAGAQDRNEETSGQAGHSLPAVLAEVLAKRGIASLRLDDPGVGESTAEFTTRDLYTLVDDAIRAYKALTGGQGIDGRRVAIVGHGEGAQIATMAVVEGRLSPAALVMIGAPSESLPSMEIERAQTRLRAKEQGDAEAIEKLLRPRQLLYDLIRRARGWNDVIWVDDAAEGGELLKQFQAWQRDFSFDYIRQHFDEEPRATLLMSARPTLIVTGGRDAVAAPGHARSLATVLEQAGRRDHQLLIVPMHDHDLAQSGQALSSQVALDRIGAWLAEQFGAR